MTTSPAWWARLRREGRELGRATLDVIAPPHCPSCGVVSAGLCLACATLTEERPPPVCERCGEPLLSESSPCPQDHRIWQGLAAVRAPFGYRGTGGRLVRRVKFERDTAALLLLARRMAAAVAPWLSGDRRRAVFASVPLSGAKRRRRGFDQAAQLAEAVVAQLEAPLVSGALKRTRDTLPQGDPRVTSRSRNVAGAFAVRRPRAVRGRTVVLVDDVTTSGHTARACAAVLRAAGAREVALLAACRARGDPAAVALADD
ncbi:MAG: phosphoribosyltransferase family protein [Planctomycetota bacterium]